MARTFRSSASFGKRQEFSAIAELMRRGYDVYITLVDDQGIDCIVRQNENTYYDVQIKARSAISNPRNAGFFPILNIASPRSRYIFIFFSEAATQDEGKGHGVYWVIPSDKLAEPGFGNKLKSGNNEGAYRVKLTNHSSKSGLVTPRPKYQQFINAFEAAFGPAPHAGNHDD